MKQLCLSGLLSIFIFLQVGCGGQDTMSEPEVCSPATEENNLTETASVLNPSSLNREVTRFLVKTRSATALVKTLQSSGRTVRKFRVRGFEVRTSDLLSDGWQVIEVASETHREALLEELLKNSDVESVEADIMVKAAPVKEEALGETARGFTAAAGWAHKKVHSLQAWTVSRGSEQVVVAIADGGVDRNHRDLEGNLWRNNGEVLNGRDDDNNGYPDDVYGWDFVRGDNDPRPDVKSHKHGSHVAGIVGAVAKNGARIIGHAPRVRLMPLKFIDSDGQGRVSDAIRAIDYAIRNGAQIINMSFSTPVYSKALYDAVVRARRAGILVVAASGNDGVNADSKPFYPAAFGLDNVISVAASDSRDRLASFSNYGRKSVDVTAPGVSIVSTAPGGTYANLSGTSMAAPLVTGIAVLVKARHPGFAYKALASSLLLGVEKYSELTSKVRSGGRIDAYKAILASDEVNSGKVIHTDLLTSSVCPAAEVTAN
ncbi:MAG: S8 family peptidase [Bdellovibrionales bacterium]